MKFKSMLIGLSVFCISTSWVISSTVTLPVHSMGVTYNGLHKSTNPIENDIIGDLSLVKNSGITAIRLYYPQYNSSIALMPLTKNAELKTLLSLFIFPGHLNDWVPANYNNFIKPYLLTNSEKLIGVLIGNEDIGTNSAIYNTILKYLKQVKIDNPKMPVSTAQTTDFWLNDVRTSHVAGLCDFIAVNIYPIWDWTNPDSNKQPQLNSVSLTPEQGVQSFIEQYNKIKKKYVGKQIVVTETGWPTTFGWVVNEPLVKQTQKGIDNAEEYYNLISLWAKKNNVNVYYYSMFDDWYGVNTSSQFNFHFGRLGTDGKNKIVNSI